MPRVEYEDIISGTGRLNKDIFAKESDKTGIIFHKGDPYTTFRCVNSARDGWTATVGWLIKGDNFENGTYRLVYNGIAKRLVKAKMNYIPFSVESSPFKVGV